MIVIYVILNNICNTKQYLHVFERSITLSTIRLKSCRHWFERSITLATIRLKSCTHSLNENGYFTHLHNPERLGIVTCYRCLRILSTM